MSLHTPYRWCIAPICNNTSSKTPGKLFIRVPSDDIYMRNIWIQLAGRDPTKLSTKSLLYLCEDHFDLERDMENYMRFKIMGSVKKIRMKPNTIPCKFSCTTVPSRAAANPSTVHPRSVDELIYDVPFVKEEAESMDEEACVKVEPFLDDGGVSEGHVVKHQLVLGPERVERPPSAYIRHSKSALQHVARCTSSFRGLPIAYTILKLISKSLSEGKNVILQWIPSHVGLDGNEAVDTLARQACCDGAECYMLPFYSDCITLAKRQTYSLWKEYFDKRSKEKGIWYKTIQPHPQITPWIDCSLSRRDLVLLMRLRSGHIPLNKGYMMGKVSSPNCDECDVPEDVYHVLMECIRNDAVRRQLTFNSNFDVGTCNSALATPLSDAAAALLQLALFVKKEPVSMDEEACVKAEPLSDEEGVSEAAMMAGLYTEHVVKQELVLGPERVERPQGYIHNWPRLSERGARPERCIEPPSAEHEQRGTNSTFQHAETNIYVCDTCGRIYQEKNSLIVHLRVHRRKVIKGNKTKPYTCEICKKHFGYTSSLSIHKRLHAGVKPYACNICKKTFIQSSQLKRHERIHTGVKLYYCEVCNKKFRESGQLKLHKWSHTEDKPYSCEICKKGFARFHHYKVHKFIHTKPFSCHICKRGFARLRNLKIHTAVHTGEKPYACDICKKGFVTSSNLKAHKRIHSSDIRYSCEKCGLRFTRSRNLKTHGCSPL